MLSNFFNARRASFTQGMFSNENLSVQQGWRARADLKGSSMAICQAKQGTCKVQQNTESALLNAA
jgi:hypothetical protein